MKSIHSRFAIKMITVIAYAVIGITLTGCAGMVRRADIARDLRKIVAEADCPTACEGLKLYIKNELSD